MPADHHSLFVVPDYAPSNLGGSGGVVGGDRYEERLTRLEEKVEHLATKKDLSKLESELVLIKWFLGIILTVGTIGISLAGLFL